MRRQQEREQRRREQEEKRRIEEMDRRRKEEEERRRAEDEKRRNDREQVSIKLRTVKILKMEYLERYPVLCGCIEHDVNKKKQSYKS